MEPTRARDFLAKHHRAVMLTHHPDGRPQMSPVLCAVDDAGRVIVSTRTAAIKTRNVLRDPRVAFCVTTDAFFGDWIQLEGEAEVVRLPEAMELLVDYYRRVGGEHPDWTDYRTAMEREQRVLIRTTISRAGPDVHR